MKEGEDGVKSETTDSEVLNKEIENDDGEDGVKSETTASVQSS